MQTILQSIFEVDLGNDVVGIISGYTYKKSTKLPFKYNICRQIKDIKANCEAHREAMRQEYEQKLLKTVENNKYGVLLDLSDENEFPPLQSSNAKSNIPIFNSMLDLRHKMRLEHRYYGSGFTCPTLDKMYPKDKARMIIRSYNKIYKERPGNDIFRRDNIRCYWCDQWPSQSRSQRVYWDAIINKWTCWECDD